MRWLLVLMALAGVAVSAAALREHYRIGTSPCSINERWDCGAVNHSPYAVFLRVPVAVIGMAGYALLAILGLMKTRRGLLLVVASLGLAFSLYLTHIEASILGVWCIYCVISLSIISLICLAAAIYWATYRLSHSAGRSAVG